MFFAKPNEYEPCGIFTTKHFILTKIENKKGSKKNFLTSFFGADGGTRTHMVSRWILSPVRLPIPPHRHFYRVFLTLNVLSVIASLNS